MTVKIGEKKIKELNIFAKSDVQKKHILNYFNDFITNMDEWIVSGIEGLD